MVTFVSEAHNDTQIYPNFIQPPVFDFGCLQSTGTDNGS